MIIKSVSLRIFIWLAAAALALATVPGLKAQTVFFSDNFTRSDSTNLDVGTNGMGGIVITAGTLPIGAVDQSPWYVGNDFYAADTPNTFSNALVAANQLRFGGFGHSVNIFPNYNFSSLVATGIVTITVGLTNQGPQGAATHANDYDRYVGIGVGFNPTVATAGASSGGAIWMQTSNDLFVCQSANGYINIWDNLPSQRGGGANNTWSNSIGGGAWQRGTLRIDLFVTNTTAGAPVYYNVLWNPGGGVGFTNIVTGRTFTWGANNNLCAGIEERSTTPVTNFSFSISSSSYTPPGATALIWRATADNNWNTTSIDWVDNLGLNSYAYFDGANVVFNDSTTNSSVNIPGTVSPGSMLLNNVNSNYVFSGSGTIAGAGTLTMSGSGLATLALANTYSGGTVLGAGRLLLGNNNALGSGLVTLSGGALSSDGGTARVITNAFSVGGASTMGDPNDSGTLTVSNVVNFGGTAENLIVNSAVVFADGMTNGTVNLKQGPGTLTIEGTVNYASYNVSQDVQAGTLIYNGATVNTQGRVISDASPNNTGRLVITNGSSIISTSVTGNLRAGRLGAATGTNYTDLAGFYSLPNADAADGNVSLYANCAYSQVTFWPGGDFTARSVVSYTNGASGILNNTVINFNGGILRARQSNVAFCQGIASAVVQSGGANIDDGGFAITINQALLDGGGGGGLNKIGLGSLTLASANTYTGNTVVSNGTVNVTGSLSGGGSVLVASNAALAGSGTIAGPVSVLAGSTLAPGSVAGIPVTLTLQNSLTLAGNVLVLINESLAPSNDLVSVAGSLNNAGVGTLIVSNVGPAYVGGEIFQIFSKPLPNGNTVAIMPATPGLGLTWTNNLAVNGTIGVAGTPVAGTPADLSNLTLSAGTLSPAFKSNILSYATSLEYTNRFITVTPTSFDPACTIQIIADGATNAVASGSTSTPIMLNLSTNLIDVQVTSADTLTVRSYFINVNRIRPNVILILSDDQGFCDWGCYGSEIKTPNLDSLASNGLRFRSFYNASMCSPTRCSILTGLYTQQAGNNPAATLPELRTDNNITIAELLKANGYHTYMSGKWHLGNTTAQLPEDRGFEEVFTYADGNAGDEDEWTPSDYRFATTDSETTNIVYNSTNFYQPDVIGDYCMQFLNNQWMRHTNQPFFLYIPFGSSHYPIQAPLAWADTNVPVYQVGWDVLRYQRYTNMLAKGVIDPRYALSPNEGTAPLTVAQEAIPAWNTLSSARQADLAQRMAIYAAMVQKMDQNIGRVIQNLQQNGQLNNTIIMALADNGGNTSGGVFGLTGSTPDAAPVTGSALANMGLAGQPTIYLGGGWAHVSNTPFRWFKRWVHNGGIGTPFVVSWPDGLTRTNQWESQIGHLIDVMATVVDVTGTSYPTNFNSHTIVPKQGISLAPWFNTNTPDVARSIGWEHEANRAFISGNWKFVNKNFTSFDGSEPSYILELYDLSKDPSEVTNVANANLPILAQMVTNWNNWCNYVGDDSYLLLNYLTNPPPIVDRDPVPDAHDLFVDTFNRPDGTNIDDSTNGMWGSFVPPLGAGSTYYKGYQNYKGYGNGQVLPSIKIVTNALWANFNPGTADVTVFGSENGIECNFTGQNIVNAGGFSVEMNIEAIGADYDDPTNYYAGFGVGLTQAQAKTGGDVSAKLASGAVAFRGELGGNTGVSPFFIDLNLNGNIEVWTNGVLLNSIPVGQNYGTLTVSFACNGFNTTNPVTVSVLLDGELVDINPANTNSFTQTFNWAQNNNNYIGLSARARDRVQIDNFAVRTLSLVDDLVMAYAMSYGLSGTNAAPGADPDGDGVNNFAEWAFGGDPTTPDAAIASLRGVQVLPGNNFMFEFQRYINYAAVGLQYHYFISSDLINWTETTPTLLSASQNEDKMDYEVVTMSLPSSATTNQSQLFLRVSAASSN